MEVSQPTAAQQQRIDQVYEFAADLLVRKKLSGPEVTEQLVAKGLDTESADIVVSNLEVQIRDARKKAAKKDMLHGGLWCVGGLALTLADIGFIFWGAIIFGGIQFLKGLTSLK